MRKFNNDELFCKKCFTHDTFFKNGGSHVSDSCPECGGTECVMYKNLSSLRRSKTRDKFKVMWEKTR